MIEINLSPTKKAGSITNVGGIDLSLINVKMLLIAFVILYVPEGFVESYYDEQNQAEVKTQQKLRAELRTVSDKVSSMRSIEKQVDALRGQEDKLARKLDVVKEIINKRQNPFEVLRYITDNVPPNLWLTRLELLEGEMIFIGYATDFNAIGTFLGNLKTLSFLTKIYHIQNLKT
jgi:Tfp pilus assembly protein PilN